MHLALIFTLLASPAFGETQRPLVHSPAPLALIDSLPHLTSPDAAAARINLDMRRRDRAVMAAALDCGTTAAVAGGRSGEFGWERGVTVTMPGPRYLAIFVSDTAWCGGPHAAESRFSLVYDLQTGLPVDWTALLPVAWVRGQAASPDAPSDAMTSQTLHSPALTLWYMTHHDRAQDTACASHITGAGPGFILYPDAASHSLILFPVGLPHATRACAGPLSISVTDLRIQGAAPALITALTDTAN